MTQDVESLYKEVVSVLGKGEDLIDECETTSCYTIVMMFSRYEKSLKKVLGSFNGRPHWWIEVDGEIIDLSIEQFGYEFQFPVTDSRRKMYCTTKKMQMSEELFEDSLEQVEASGFYI